MRPQRAYAAAIVLAIVVGVAVRLFTIGMAPQRSYLPDHEDALAWGTYAYRHGPLTLYDMPPRQPIFISVGGGAERVRLSYAPHEYNYPPLSAYVFLTQAFLWHTIETQPIPRSTDSRTQAELAARGVDPRFDWLPAWTLEAQFASAAPSVPIDILLAFGVLYLVRYARPVRSKGAELLAFCLAMAAPPLFLNSSFWNQYEVWVTCPCVWAMVCLMNNRALAAGALFGVAFMIKTSALVFVPALGFAILSVALANRASLARAVQIPLAFAAGSLCTILIAAAPFMMRDMAQIGAPGAYRWLERSYLAPLSANMYPYTTLSAFNIWWLDYLSQVGPTGSRNISAALDPNATMLGMTKDAFGRALAMMALFMGAAIAALRSRGSRESWLAFAAVSLLAAFALPTRVHERYIYFCVPFFIAMSACRLLWLAPCVLVLVVGTFEMTSFRWINSRVLFTASAGRAGSLLLAAFTVLALLISFVLLGTGRRPARATSEALPRRGEA